VIFAESNRKVDGSYLSIVAFDNQSVIWKFFDNPSLHKSSVWIFQPHISLAGEVILSLNATHGFKAMLYLV